MFNDEDPENRKVNLAVKTIVGGPRDLNDALIMVEGLAKPGQISTVVCENYRIRADGDSDPTKRAAYGRSRYAAQKHDVISKRDFWSEVKTIRVIGAAEFFAQRVKAEFVIQEPAVLGMGRKWCDFPITTKHIPDDISAYIHGAHFMMKSGLIRSVADISKFGAFNQGELA